MDFEFRNLMPNLNFNVVSPHRSKSLSFVICPHLLRTPPLHCFLASVVDLLSAAADQLPAADMFFTASDVFFTVADVFFTAAGLAQQQTRFFDILMRKPKSWTRFGCVNQDLLAGT
ncbi:uncharacterized protein LOC114168177 [Vigna unguiculata]|uniref:uncharacterized protein LOC114168177 n=1 Tax=Vigna unguiculata TaxID=3917 RepID=UPI001016D3BA|nr:uncharacterized protein LOC114168177 [Vigna unguiculata]